MGIVSNLQEPMVCLPPALPSSLLQLLAEDYSGICGFEVHQRMYNYKHNNCKCGAYVLDVIGGSVVAYVMGC